MSRQATGADNPLKNLPYGADFSEGFSVYNGNGGFSQKENPPIGARSRPAAELLFKLHSSEP